MLASHHHRDLDLAGSDHLDVDAFLRQGAEHPFGDARLCGHAQADDRDFRDLIIAIVAFGAEFLNGFVHRAESLGKIVARD